MSAINTNVKALYTQAALKVSGRDGATAMQQLSTGKRINSAKDDAAGMAIADRMTQQIRSLNQAVRNAGDAISLIQTAEGATNEITDMLQRMRELSIQAINDTNSGDQRAYLDLEFQQLKQEIVRISETTEWNGFPLLNGSAGIPQGEQPVYKVQSTPGVTTAATYADVTGTITEPIEQQVVTFSDADPTVRTYAVTASTAAGALVLSMDGMDDVTVLVDDSDTAAEVAAKIVYALNNNDDSASNSDFVSLGRLAIDDGDGNFRVQFSAADAETDIALTITTVASTATAPTPSQDTSGDPYVDTLDFTSETLANGAYAITVDGLSSDIAVLIEDGDDDDSIAAKVAAALNGDDDFVALGASATDNSDGTVSITYAAGETPTIVAIAASDTDSAATEDSDSPSGGGTITVGGVSVTVTAGDSKEDIATAVAAALNDDTFVTSNDGRIVVDNGDGTITITYNEDDGDVDDLSYVDTGSTGVAAVVSTTSVADTEISFSGTSGLLKSGNLALALSPTQPEVQRIVFGPAAAASSSADPITVGDVEVITIDADDTAAEVAAKVHAALLASTAFGIDSGRTLTDNGDGSLTIEYTLADGDAEPIAFADASTATGITASVATVNNYGSLTATYDVEDGSTVTLNGQLDATNGTVTFSHASVAQVDTLTFAGTFETTASEVTLTVDDYVLSLTIDDATTVAEDLVAAINADTNMSGVVTAELQRDGTVTLTAVTAGEAFNAYATLARVDGNTATISSETTTENIDAGDNALVVASDMTVTLIDSGGDATDLTYLGTTVSIDVSRSFNTLPALSAGDLIINGVTVGPSLAADDTISSSNNDGGAISKAAAINRVKDLTGVQAVVSETVLTGTAMSAGESVSGTLTINGYTSPVITTTLNNARVSRATVVEAINRMTARTGVVAVDTGSDAKGVRLEAADGRNIEVFFNTGSDDDVFAARTGLRAGLTTGSIALEATVDGPIVLTSTGTIANSGFIAGDFTSNQTVVNSQDRVIAVKPTAQISSVAVTGTLASAEEFSVTINGRTKTVAVSDDAKQTIDDLISLIAADSTLAATVTATRGANQSEIYLTSVTPGIEFTVTASTDSADGYIDVEEVVANADATNFKLNTGDLLINGVAIPGSSSADDIRSPAGIYSNQADSSSIAIAAAINSVSDKTGVRAEIKAASLIGSTTTTGAPAVYPETGYQSLYINGIEVEIYLTEDEAADTRRENVVAAINRKLDSHGATASNNGSGVTLTSSDGRNVSVWFDSAVPGLSASSFGLSTGDEVAQVSTITVSEGGTSDTTATVSINGVSITTDAFAAGSSTTVVATAIESAINAAMTNGSLSNLSVSAADGVVTITSTIAGSGFTILGADSDEGGVEMAIETTTANSVGSNLVTGLWNGDADSMDALTMYSGIALISEEVFTVAAGANGYADAAHWSGLGFVEGSFGGDSSVEMASPRVGRMTFQVGATLNQSINIDFADFGKEGTITGDITGDVDLWNSDERVNRIDNREDAQAILTKLDAVLDKVNGTRATMGAVMNRLEHVIDNLMNVSMNTEASRSQIEDADYAAASTELARTQIMQQAGISVLAQANADQQNVLKLLQ